RSNDYPQPPFPPQQTGPPPGLEENMKPRPQYLAPEYRAAGKLKTLAALITGGDSGIGRSVAVLFAREGANVAFTYLPEEEVDAKETLEAIRAEGTDGLAIAGDVRDWQSCRAAVEQTVNKF